MEEGEEEEEEEGQRALGRGARPWFPELCAEKEVEGEHPADWLWTRTQLTGTGAWPWPKHNQGGPNGLCLLQGERHSSAPSLLLLAPLTGLGPTAILPFGLLQMVMTCLSQVSSANRASEGACLWKLSPAGCQLNPTPQFSTLQEASRKPAWGSTPEGRSLVAWLVCLMPTPSPFCLQLAALSSWPGPSWQALAGTQAVQSLPGLTVLTIEAVVPTLCQVPACKKKGRVSTQRHCTLQGSRGTRSACLTKPFCGSRTEWRLGCSKNPWKFLQGMAGVVPPPPSLRA